MSRWNSGRGRLLVSAALLALVAGLGVRGHLPKAPLGRALLWGAPLAGLSLALFRHASRRAQASALQLQERVPLSPRCGLALIRCDGIPLLVAYGDGTVQVVHPPSSPLGGLRRWHRPCSPVAPLRRNRSRP